jgi:beta-xylosidase
MVGGARAGGSFWVRTVKSPLLILSVLTVTIALVTVSLLMLRSSHATGSTPANGRREAAALNRAPTTPAPLFSGVLPKIGDAQVVFQDDVGDPFVLPVPGGVRGDPTARYVLFWTTDWRSNVPTAVSSDLIHWHRIADALPVLPSWALASRTMTWGPAAIRVAGGWVLYYSTEDAANQRECIGRAFSKSPVGPFADTSTKPFICQANLGGSIDPSVVGGGPGGLSLVWKNDGNSRRLPVGIWQQQLSKDGLTLRGGAHRLIGADQAWEQGIVEGPAMLRASSGGWWLFYSGGSWQSNTYNTGVAWCATVAGPCRPASPQPLLSSTATAVSPGGLDTFVDSRGKLWASYSAFPGEPANARAAMAENRVLEIAPVLTR